MATTANGQAGRARIDDLSFLLARANAVSLQAATAALRPFGLKTRSYSVLAMALSDEPPSQREIAEYLRLDPSQVVALVDGLQERGLVSRETDERDRRARVVVATQAGARLYADVDATVHGVEDEVLRELDASERALLRELLNRIAFPAQD
ncbi:MULTISPECIES: MarR family winged helix-turn-helix transcriptional regulator [unclassified Microbacterium]|uniref:MarR family winged helix-turn-helix transcriptional regulator n=1 Tax=unclassified Microbacterium TaxID=2609290 RepID=UPI00097F52D8|nr:MarR family transcriptional regulator [Microbacterium sp. JB110]RCS60946.1 MarR family transcriptional regulator [Microbacterium sp. JB110]SJM59312.1 Transcriptional regulator, MarR family [Frigoribacterium sp. JB110]